MPKRPGAYFADVMRITTNGLLGSAAMLALTVWLAVVLWLLSFLF